MHVKHDRTETVDHHETITVHHNRTESVDNDEHIDIGHNRTEVVGKNESVRIIGFRAEKVDRAKTETVTLAKALSIGGAYAITVGAVMHTVVVGAKYLRALRNILTIAEKMEITAGTEFEVTVGQSHFRMSSDGKITLTGADITIGATGPVQINGNDVDVN